MATDVLEPEMLVRDLLRAHPTAVVVLDRYRIDWCCGAGRLLGDACASAGVTVSQICADVAQAEASAVARALDVHRFESMALSEVVTHVECAHHGFTKSERQRLCGLAAKVAARHGDAHEELRNLERTLAVLFDELDAHMKKEERVLFTMIRALDGGAWAPFPSPAPTIAVMRAEHGYAVGLLAQIARMTDNFRSPPEACPSWCALYDGLLELDADFRHHAWIENEIVFPRALGLWKKGGAGDRRHA